MAYRRGKNFRNHVSETDLLKTSKNNVSHLEISVSPIGDYESPQNSLQLLSGKTAQGRYKDYSEGYYTGTRRKYLKKHLRTLREITDTESPELEQHFYEDLNDESDSKPCETKPKWSFRTRAPFKFFFPTRYRRKLKNKLQPIAEASSTCTDGISTSEAQEVLSDTTSLQKKRSLIQKLIDYNQKLKKAWVPEGAMDKSVEVGGSFHRSQLVPGIFRRKKVDAQTSTTEGNLKIYPFKFKVPKAAVAIKKGKRKSLGKKAVVKSDKGTQMFEHITTGDLFCIEWINNNLFEVNINPYTIVVDEKIKDISLCPSGSSIK